MTAFDTPSLLTATADGGAIELGDFVRVNDQYGIALTDAADGETFDYGSAAASWFAKVPANTKALDLLYIDDASTNPVSVTRTASGAPIARALTDRDGAGRATVLLFDVRPTSRPNLPASPDADDIAAALVALGFATQVSCVATGTAVAGGVTEAQIVTGGQTIILTLTGGEWVSGAFASVRSAIRAGIVSDGMAAHGWTAEVTIPLGSIVRTSDTVVTITTPAAAAYAIAADETLTVTVPAAAIANCDAAVVATPTIPITAA